MTRIGIAVALLVYGLDRVGKWTILEVLRIPEAPVLWGPFFGLVFVQNTGVSFGMLQNDMEIGRWLLVGFSVGVSLVLLVWMSRAQTLLLAIGLGMVIGGAVGNATDRIAWGYVVDYFYFHVGVWSFPVFNIADSAIVIGFGLIVFDGLLVRRKHGM